MSISDTIKKLRTEQRLTQQEFADRIGVKRNTVATYEMGRSEPSEAAVMLICREFGVRREWLVTGEGEMYVQRDTAIIEKLSSEFDLDEQSREFIKNFLQLTPANRQMILAGLQQAALLFPRKPDNELTKEEAQEIIGREFDAKEAAEKRATSTSSAFTGSSGTSKKFWNSP